MKNDYTGDNYNSKNNNYGSFSNNYGNTHYGSAAYRYCGGHAPSYGNYGYGSYGNVGEEQGPQITLKDYIFLVRERI